MKAGSANKVAITRRFSLAGAGHGWGEENYIDYIPLTYADRKRVRETQPGNMTEEEAVEFALNFTKEHVVSGKILTRKGDETVTENLVASHLDQLPVDVIDNLFEAMNGVQIDPKVTGTAVPDSVPPPPSESPTETI